MTVWVFFFLQKVPGTGELVIIGVDAVKPYVELGVISGTNFHLLIKCVIDYVLQQCYNAVIEFVADGKKMIHKVDLQYKRSALCHDVGITERYKIRDKNQMHQNFQE